MRTSSLGAVLLVMSGTTVTYVDHERKQSIDMEMFLGHDIGFADPHAPWGIARIGKTGQSSGVDNTYRIPFGFAIPVPSLPSTPSSQANEKG